NISTSPEQAHPLKTFDTFASGKIKLNDVLILSNTQLLNFLSMDRLREILSRQNFLAAAQTIIELLKEMSGPEVAFGTILNLQVPAGQAGAEGVDLENYIVENKQPLIKTAVSFAKNLLGLESARRQPKSDLPKISVTERFAKIKNSAGRI